MRTFPPIIFAVLGIILAGASCSSNDTLDTSNGSDSVDTTDSSDSGDNDSGHEVVTEECNGVDDDFDGLVDEDWDLDADGYIQSGVACAGNENIGDCDDADPFVNPGATEICDGKDNDCDTHADNTGDLDGDGYSACEDCDDTNPWTNPDASEVCDGKDNDCDSFTDEDFDNDGDGVARCGGDCDDDDFYNSPITPEMCDGQDNDCDDEIDEGFDVDEDGYTTCRGDCDDTNADIYPGAVEICDGLESDCDPATSDYGDGDGDGYTPCDGDCDDTNAAVYPGATESCDGVDNDCDGEADSDLYCTYDCTLNSGFWFCTGGATWATAEAFCVSIGSHLASVYDSTENTTIATLAASYASGAWWIGFNDVSSEGSWVWSDGSSVTYTHWNSGEPNDSGGEDCADTNSGTSGGWNDLNCSTSQAFVCNGT
jgi:hypothetical protein